MGLAAGDGAPQDVEALPLHQQRVPLAGGARDRGAAAGPWGRPCGPDDPRWGAPVKERRNVVVFMGTRPEAIKLAPVVAALGRSLDFDCTVVATGQHKELFSQVADQFGF